jgi:hypothetical protein
VSGERRTEGEPHDRLTRLCAAMTDALDAHPEREGDERCIVFLHGAGRGGIVLHGYDGDDAEALADLLVHLRAIFRSRGQEFLVVPLGRG